MTHFLLAIPSASGKVPLEIMQAVMGQVMPCKDMKLTMAYTERIIINLARNLLAKKALEVEADYIWFVDDDTIPPRDALKKLYELDKDIVCPPVADRSGGDKYALMDYPPWKAIREIKENRKIYAGGMSCTLIKTPCLKAVFDAYNECPFEFERREEPNGDVFLVGEDIEFCKRANDLGFECWARADLRPIHLGERMRYQYNK